MEIGGLKLQLLYEAKLDAAGSAISRRDVYPDKSAAEVRPQEGAMELAILKPNGNVAIQLRRNIPASAYFSEVSFKVRADAPALLSWALIAGPAASIYVAVEPEQESARVDYVPSGGGNADTLADVSLDGLSSGKVVTLGVAVEPGKLRLFVDGKEVEQASDERIAFQRVNAPIFFSAISSNEGSVTITGVLLYALAR